VYTLTRIEGSNPSLSARPKNQPRIAGFFLFGGERVKGGSRFTQREAEEAILALIEDIAMVRRELGTRDPFAQIVDDGDREAAITAELTEVLDSHRRSSLRWDFIGVSNSTGAHSPEEALRVLEQAVVLARGGQVLLKGVAARHGIELIPTSEPTRPAVPAVLEPGNIVGSPPPAITREADRATNDRLLQ
jgi:nitrite reductase (cytochrome c-552)